MPSTGYGPTMREESGSGDASGGWHLAQFNIARMRFPIDSAEKAEFVAGLDPINFLGERSPGFVWRHGMTAARRSTPACSATRTC